LDDLHTLAEIRAALKPHQWVVYRLRWAGLLLQIVPLSFPPS
jgi:hypothetical protein